MLEPNQTQPENQTQSQKKFKDVILPFCIFIIIVSLFVFGSTYLTRFLRTADKDEIEKIVKEVIKEKEIIIKKPICERSFEAYSLLKSKGQFIQLADSQSSYAYQGHFTSNIKPTVFISGEDDIACGYLYLKLSKSNKPLDKLYDSIYINPHSFGGHILREKGIILNEAENYTEAIIPLNAVSYLPGLPYNSKAQNFKIADWSKLLNVNSHVSFDIGLSTMDKGGMINDITIVYKCWDMETGKESNNCQLSIEK